MALGDYQQMMKMQHLAWKRLLQSAWGSEEYKERNQLYEELKERRAAYLHDLLAQLPFHWHIAHAYTPNESAGYGGADHIIVDESIHIGRLQREPGDALSRRRERFWGLSRVEDDRLPTALADIKIAERIVAGG